MKKIKLINNENYRPVEIIYDNELYSRSLYLEKYGYWWKASAGGNILYYMSLSGKTLAIKQDTLTNMGK